MIAGNQGQNIYPDPDNYPDTSFPQPVPAPQVDPDDAGTLITVQYSWAWREVLMAAVDQLLNPATWEGDHDAIIDALNRATNLKDLLQINLPASDIAPYWQDESDIEGEIPEGETQNWWGVFDGLDFQASLENVFIAAYVGILAGPGAAAQFLVLARQFRLQFERDPYGGIVDILINGDKYRSVDTYSPTPDILSVDIIASETDFEAFDVDPKTLLIVLTDEANDASTPKVMHVVRKQLIASEVSPPNFRYDPDTNKAQFSPDDGSTWVDSPGTDPRHNSTYLLPPRGGADPRCDAAANMVAALRFTVNVIISAPSTLAEINILLGYVKRFIPEIAFIIKIISYAVNFLNIIKDELEDAFTEEAYETIECSLKCHTQPDGTITATGLSAVMAEIFAYDPDVLFTATQFIFQTWWGETGLSNAGAIGDAVGDCSECDECNWCRSIDLTVTDGGFTTLLSQARGEWQEGVGWVSLPFTGLVLLQIENDYSAYHIDAVHVYYDAEYGSSGASSIQWNSVEVYGSFTPGIGIDAAFSTSDGAPIFLNMQASTSGGGGSIRVYQITLQGHGEPIPDGDDCY